jgi:hypothetical protein
MKYSDIIQFEPIETVVQLRECVSSNQVLSGIHYERRHCILFFFDFIYDKGRYHI